MVSADENNLFGSDNAGIFAAPIRLHNIYIILPQYLYLWFHMFNFVVFKCSQNFMKVNRSICVCNVFNS